LPGAPPVHSLTRDNSRLPTLRRGLVAGWAIWEPRAVFPWRWLMAWRDAVVASLVPPMLTPVPIPVVASVAIPTVTAVVAPAVTVTVPALVLPGVCPPSAWGDEC
jgi:hypothetical protein